jgi:Cu2+-exporting ATPase
VARNGSYAARIQLKDRVRDTAAGAIAELRRAGVRRVLLASGDRRSAVRSLSRRLGLDGCWAELMPEGKVALVDRLRRDGARVAVVGDGLNDAPAMAAADVSVAVPRGADLARNTADIVLMTEDLHDLVTAIQLSQQAMVLVRQNIGLVAVPNSLGMALATLGGLGPLPAAILNNGSTLVAAMNGLRPLLSSPVPSLHPIENRHIPTP